MARRLTPTLGIEDLVSSDHFDMKSGLAAIAEQEEEDGLNALHNYLRNIMVKPAAKKEGDRGLAAEEGEPETISALEALGPDQARGLASEMAALFGRQRKPSEALVAQGAKVDENAKTVAKYKRGGPGLDLSPLKGMADAMFGTNLQKDIPDGSPSGEKYALSVAKMEDLIQDQRNDLSQRQAAELGEAMNVKMMDSISRQARADERQTTGYTNTIRDNIDKRVLRIGSADDFVKAESGLNRLMNAFRTRKVGEYRAAATQFARSVMGEVGAQSEGDVGRAKFAGLETKLLDFSSWIDTDPDAKIPANVANAYVKMVSDARRYMAESRLRQLKASWKDFKTAPYYNKLMGAGGWGNEKFADTMNRLAEFGDIKKEELGKLGFAEFGYGRDTASKADEKPDYDKPQADLKPPPSKKKSRAGMVQDAQGNWVKPKVK